MNIWHDISPKRIKKDRFYAVIEISKGGKNKYELDKETGMLKLDSLHQLTTLPTTDLSQEHTQATTTLLMFWCFAVSKSDQ